MNPTKSERKSRRSSILKPPKPRQPFENVELNASSTENSPATTTTKIKRRVSFAEKKHVKEFCDSPEQGTVWDNTYEESESSHTKNGQNSNNDEMIISDEVVAQSRISIVTESSVSITQSISKETSKVSVDSYFSAVESDFNLRHSTNSVVSTKTSGIPFPANHSKSFNARRSLSVTEIVFAKSANKENDLHSAKASEASNITGFQNPLNSNPLSLQDGYCNEVSKETPIGDVSVGHTPLTLSKSGSDLRSSFNMVPNLDFVKSGLTSGLLPFGKDLATSKEATGDDDKENPQKTIEPTESNTDQAIFPKTQDTIAVYCDTSMEMSEALTNRKSLTSKHPTNKTVDKESKEEPILAAEQKTTFQMKAEETVTKILGLSSTSFKESDRISLDLRPERMPIFHNKSVRLGEVVQNISSTQKFQQISPERTPVIRNEPVDFTDIVQDLQSTEKPHKATSERTTIFHDKSLDFTEAVQNVPSKEKCLSQDRTTVFRDKSLDFTEVVRSRQSHGNQQKLSAEKTNLFHHQSLDMTEVVQSLPDYQKSPSEKTTLFHNQLVDMTEVVPSCPSYQKSSPKKMTIFHDQPVDMTEVVPSCPSYEKPLSEKTMIFQNHSVEMTEAVRSYPNYGNPPPEKPAIFQNQTMDMTEVIRGRPSYQKSAPEKTTIFHNQSVEMTEAVRSYPNYGNPPPAKPTIFQNQTMDMTEVIRGHPSYQKSAPEKTTIFHNQSVEMTEAVQSHPSSEIPPPEKTTIFHNLSVDMTEAVRSHPNCEILPPEKSTIFHNQSVDMTEVVRSHPSYQKSSPEKTTIFHNQPVDMTEVVRSLPSYQKSPEKTTIFHNQPVDMTEVVQSHPSYQKSPPEKTTIFHNQPVDMTEVVQSHPSYQKSPPEKTAIFHNQPVDMTEVVRSHPSYQKSPPEKTTILHNQSRDMTEVVRNHPSYQKSPPDETTMYNNQPVYTPEVVRSSSIYRKLEMSKIIPSGLSIQESSHQDLVHEASTSRSQRTSVFPNTSVGFIDVQSEENEQPENTSPELTEAVSRVAGLSRLLSRDSCTLAVERHARQEPLDLEEANRLIASIEVNIPDPEVRSPVPKRMKSLGSRRLNHSMDVTAAIPFVVYRKLARQKCNEINSMNSNLSSVEGNSGKTSNSEASGKKSMDITKVDAGSSNVEPLETFPVEPIETFSQEAQEKTTNFQNRSMEMIEATRCLYPIIASSEKCMENDDWPRPQDNTICHDDSMEITKVIPGILKANVPICHDQSMEMTRPVSHYQNPDGEENLRTPPVLPAFGGKTMVFRDDLMELTTGVQLPSQPFEGSRRDVVEGGNSWPNAIRDLQKGGDYCNESMEYTRAVPFPVQAQGDALDKENCPLILEDIQSHSSRRSENSSSIGVSRTEWQEIMKSVPFLSSEENKENQAEPIESKEQSRDTGEITGIVPFADVENVLCRDLGLVSGKIEITENLKIDCDNVNFQPQRLSDVATKSFQPVPVEEDKANNVYPPLESVTANIDADIRKLAENYSPSNSDDESGFDQATFLRQQARCMEDYEANSTTSQECQSGTLSARQTLPCTENGKSPDRVIPDSPKMPTATWDFPNLKTANISVSNREKFTADNSFSSRVDREPYDMSLEELRCRAYSVSKFQPEVAGFDLTARSYDPHKTIVDEDPPSFLFADSLTMNATADCTASVNDLLTESDSPRKTLEKSDLSSCNIPEIAKQRNSKMEVVEIPEIIITLEEDCNKSAGDSKHKNIVEQTETKLRRQTFVIKRPNTDQTIPLPFSPEADKETKNDRISGVTTAAQFSSESSNGPNEKIRRRESESMNEEKSLSTVDKEGNATELIEVGRFCGTRKFANSTVIGEDFTRQFAHPDIEDTSILKGISFSDELPSRSVQNKDQTANLRSEVKEADDVSMELEVSAPKSPFALLKETVESLAKSPKTIWRIHRFDEKVVAFNFFSRSIVVAIYLNDNPNWDSTIKVIGFLSVLVKEGNDPGACLAHDLIMKKVNSKSLTSSYKTYEDVPRMLEYVSTEVKLGMDFMFDLERLRDRTIMDIQENRITFTVRTRDINAGIILNITMDVKPFEEISSNDITVAYLLGAEKVRENDIKRLITNVKRDHRFLRFYINDVTDYIDLMAETGFSNRV